jgi:hypothetical protein
MRDCGLLGLMWPGEPLYAGGARLEPAGGLKIDDPRIGCMPFGGGARPLAAEVRPGGGRDMTEGATSTSCSVCVVLAGRCLLRSCRVYPCLRRSRS